MAAPNVLLLVIDSLRADSLTDNQVPTPVFDRLGARGTRFLQCVTTSTLTTPAFASLLTGCYPTQHGVHSLRWNRLGQVESMAAAFTSAGYHTRAEVTGPLLPRTEVLRGFGEINHRIGHMRPFMEWQPRVMREIETFPQPWFLLLHVWELHRPYRPPPLFTKQVGKNAYNMMVEAVDEAIDPLLGSLPGETVIVVTGDHGERLARTWLGDRLAAVARDLRRVARLGRLVPPLDRALANRSIGHGFSLQEPVIRVPLILSGRDIPSGVIPDLVRHVDVFPTLSTICGVPIDDDGELDGRDLTPLLNGGSLEEETAYLELTEEGMAHPLRAVRTSEWKLLEVAPGRTRLFRIAGPHGNERVDLGSRYPEVRRELEAALHNVVQKTGPAASPLSEEEESDLEAHLRDLGYL